MTNVMKLSNVLSVFFFPFLLITSSLRASFLHAAAVSSRPTQLFVFGDSYADTGNVRKSLDSSWKKPYGVTFPGKPAGRFCDGRVLTDYVAKSMGLKRTPIAYAWRKLGGLRKMRYGMNFAYGGSGVFDTHANLIPNMTAQIDFFQNLVKSSTYKSQDLTNSAVLFSLAGNDYAAYISRGGSMKDLPAFISQVVNQLVINLERVREMGSPRIVVTGLEPLGCLPRITQFSSYQKCNDNFNNAVGVHNMMLRKAVEKLNGQDPNSKILFLDLYQPFSTHSKDKLTPCCKGTCAGCWCGSVDEKGNKLYTVCDDPKSAFFWDASHPTQAGWFSVFSSFKSDLERFFTS